MSKTQKQEQQSNTPGQSGASAATASTTATPSSESGASTSSPESLRCPACDSVGKFIVRDGKVSYCGQCGTNADWAYRNPKYAPAVQAILDKVAKSVPFSPAESTPPCDAVSRTGKKCGSKRWAHDGRKLIYCSECNASWPSGMRQPADIATIIKSLGPAIHELAIPMQAPLTNEQLQRLESAGR